MLVGTKRALLGGGVIRYLLRDEFTTNLAAGSVDGTLAQPGPGTRVVTDVGNYLSIASGAVAMVNQQVNWLDPDLAYGALTRTAGQVLIAKIKRQGLDCALFGWITSADAAIANFKEAIYARSTTETGYYDGTVIVIGGGLAYDVFHEFAIVQRTTGAFIFQKANGATAWSMLWISSVDSTASLVPILRRSGGTNDTHMDYIRVPKPTWLPAPLLSDSFNRANGVLGNTDGAGHAEANGGGGLAWNNRVGTTQIATNAASASALVGGIAIATVDVGNVNVLHEAALTRSAGNVGIVLRYADVDNYVYAYHDGINAVLVKNVAGTPTTVITAAATYAAGAIMRVIPDGTSFSLFYNNAKVGSTSTISDAGLQTGTEHGLYSSDVTNSQNNMVTWARKTGYNRLDKF